MTLDITNSLRIKAESFVDSGDLAQAEVLYREILSYNDKDTDANYMLGVILAEKADLDSAMNFLNKAIEANPQYPDSYFILAKIQQAKEEYQKAFDSCLNATSLDDEFDEAWSLLCNLSTWLKNNDQAIISCKQSIKYFPESVPLISNLAGAFFNVQDYSKAIEQYEKVVLLDPSNASFKKFLCLSLFRNKEFSQVLSSAQKMLETDANNIDLYNFVSEAYIELKEFDKADIASKKALKINPENVNAIINMGNVIQKQHKYNEAISWYEKARDIDSNNASIYHNLGISYFKLNNNERAAEEFSKAVELNPDLSVSKHMLAVANGTNEARADNEYVTDLFDEYAHRYDDHQKDLKYRVPEHINDAVQRLYSESALSGEVSVLDLGCGTGLCAPYLNGISEVLVGVDLSPDMVKLADKLDLYSELVVGDMSECMEARQNIFDLAVAGDVFVYIGDLEQEFNSAQKTLKNNAFLVFTVQVNDQANNYELTDTGRYNHADSYIMNLANKHGFNRRFSTNIISRVDYGVPVNSRVYVFQNNK